MEGLAMDWQWWATAIIVGFAGSLICVFFVSILTIISPKFYDRILRHFDASAKSKQILIIKAIENLYYREQLRVRLGGLHHSFVKKFLLFVFWAILFLSVFLVASFNEVFITDNRVSDTIGFFQ
jgi:hypothetical protein